MMPQEQGCERPGSAGVVSALAALYRLLSPRRRRHLQLCFLVMFAGAAAELFTIGAVLPFLALISDPEGLGRIPHAPAVFAAFGWRSGSEAILPATLLLCGAAAVAAAIRLLLTWVSHAFVFSFGHELGVRIYSGLLRQPYLYHTQRNSSEGLAALEKVQYSVIGVLLPVIQGLVAAVLALCIMALLIALQPVIALLSAAAVGLLYTGVGAVTRGKLHHGSRLINDAQTERMRQVQEGLGGIRDILLDRSQPIFERSFAELDGRLRRSQLLVTYIATVPRVVIESAVIILVAVLALYMSRQSGGLPAAIPLLGAFALGAQRLLPLLQLVYVALTRTAGSVHTIHELARLARASTIDVPLDEPPLPATGAIELRGVSFTYPDSSRGAVTGVDLHIAAGERVGFIGETGSGKSTLLDLIMGLLEPTAGEILIDGAPLRDATRRRWQRQIAHVPQSIYLADTSFAANIAFGVSAEERDMARVRAAAEQAQIADFIEGLPGGYQASIGERGIRLSGGQRQRLGIARALYKQAAVLVLDEATSALDDATERAVMTALSKGTAGRTVLVVAHRLSTLANCDRLVRLVGGRIVAEGSYEELVAAPSTERGRA
ncbi:ABC transporter ATP-binding protein [Sphingomonas parva]|nr:ABC transporter ATP-binding protein [Sphingomonas parva]